VPGFQYRRPSTLDEALDLLAEGDDSTKILTGGQSLVPMISLGLAQPRVVLDLNRLPGLDEIRFADGHVAIGPLVRHRTLEHAHAALTEAAPLLPAAGRLIGHAAIRTRGTFLGSIAHADPSAEWPAVALALGADLVLVSRRGERVVPAADFFLGPLTTVLEPDEVLIEARLPEAPSRTGASVLELTYRHGDYAVVGVAAQLSLREDGAIAEAHLGLISAGFTPIRPDAAERVLIGAGPDAFGEAAREAQAAVEPSTDATASAEYRREMVGVFVRRALEEAYGRAVTPHPPPPSPARGRGGDAG
jgi:aerobic carbon-monoxide dehydrogenase medium subunit